MLGGAKRNIQGKELPGKIRTMVAEGFRRPGGGKGRNEARRRGWLVRTSVDQTKKVEGGKDHAKRICGAALWRTLGKGSGS